eukprot:TRINITY_DN9075_c0_g1_i1.p1 TRINITY_DN9075_c0_g1~~TRINITY_DN9075_c0_g1_i1.p1  ORF type:complete len:376 (+),score=125.55 TRINITY_DN9075_c0_g1_i1:47-1129(+)
MPADELATPTPEALLALTEYIVAQERAGGGFERRWYRHAGMDVEYYARGDGEMQDVPVAVQKEVYGWATQTLPQKLWPASHPMAEWLASDAGRPLIEGKAVLEIGSGVGLVGLVAGKLGAAPVVMSDVAASSMALCTASLQLEGNADASHGTSVMHLKWACEEHHAAALKHLTISEEDGAALDVIQAAAREADRREAALASASAAGPTAAAPPPPPLARGPVPPPPPPPPPTGALKRPAARPPPARERRDLPAEPAPSALEGYTGRRFDVVLGADVFYFRASLKAGLASAAALLPSGGMFACVSAVRSDEMEAALHAVGGEGDAVWDRPAPPQVLTCASQQEQDLHRDYRGVTLFLWRRR